jgi:hypothetical protein
LDRSSTQVNQFFVKRFGKVVAGEIQCKFSVDVTDSINATEAIAIASISTFHEPSLVQATLHQFSEVPMKFVVKKAHEGMHSRQLTVDVDEVVECLDASAMEYWLIRKADRSEGFVPATCLKPAPVVPAGKRPPGSVAPGYG